MNPSRTTPSVAIAPITAGTASPTSRPRHLARAAAAVAMAAASLLSVAAAGASAADAAGARATASTPSPAQSARHTPSTRSQLRHILKTHYAAGDFVGARIATLDSDGRITQATAGTTKVGRPSRPVDPNLPWNIGSTTKTFVARTTSSSARSSSR